MKVLIADDHPLVRDGLAQILHTVDANAEVIEACDYHTIEQQAQRHCPDVALVDINMPGMDRMSGLKRIRQSFPQMTLIVASGDDDAPTIRAALAVGASGFLPKRDSPEVLVHALRLLLAGGSYLPARALDDLRDGKSPASQPNINGLTPRQLDVLRLMMHGEPNKLIARQLGLTEGTIKIHIAAILRVLQARNRTEAVVMAQSMGIDA